jgi:hypothetical protein
LVEEDLFMPSSPVQSTDAYGFLAADSRKVRIEFHPHGQGTQSHDIDLWWLKEVGDRLQTLVALPANWNSHGARRVTVQAVRTALVVLVNVMAANSRMPTIVPTVRGGLQLEWHGGGIDLEIEVDHTGGGAEVAFEDTETEIELDEPLTDFAVIREAMATLTARYPQR